MAEKTSNEASSSGSTKSSGGGRGESVVADVGRRRSSCGYCRSAEHSSITHGLWAHSMTVDDYQDLIDRGWRRSGAFLYKPEMERTCCPLYTIRMRVVDFVPSKEQLRVSKRMQRFLDGTLEKQNEVIKELNKSKGPGSTARNEASSSAVNGVDDKNEENNKTERVMQHLSDQIDNVVRGCITSEEFPFDIELPKASVKQVSQSKKKTLVERSANLLYTSSIAFQISAALRRAQSTEKDLSPKSIAEKLVHYLTHITQTSGLSVRACNGHVNFNSVTKEVSLDDVTQTTNLSRESSTKGRKRGCWLNKLVHIPQVRRRTFELRLNRSSFDLEEFSLYKRYQMKVHNDPSDKVTESSYRRFLVDSPLIFVPPTNDGTVPPCGFGSFHQQYLIDGRLVAVGVIDILPKCLSSKYLFWDPDFAFLSLGKYSALQEINWVQENQALCSSLQYYYLGYYVHSCNKMRYKAAYHPSELLCPLRYQWIPFDVVKPLLDRKRYVILSDFAILQNEQLSPPHVSENLEELRDNDLVEGSNDVHMDDDDDNEDMTDADSEISDEESGPGADGLFFNIENGDIGNISIGIDYSRFKYKDIRRAFRQAERSRLESQLSRYMRVVGAELSERIVYSLR